VEIKNTVSDCIKKLKELDKKLNTVRECHDEPTFDEITRLHSIIGVPVYEIDAVVQKKRVNGRR
jgi:hypothetical protein